MIDEDNDAARALVSQDEMQDMTWRLYEQIFSMLGVDPTTLADPLANQFHPLDVTVPKEHLEIVLNAVGNVLGALIYRDKDLQQWFYSKMDETCKLFAEDSRKRQQ